jgi:hypothetical protein
MDALVADRLAVNACASIRWRPQDGLGKTLIYARASA